MKLLLQNNQPLIQNLSFELNETNHYFVLQAVFDKEFNNIYYLNENDYWFNCVT